MIYIIDANNVAGKLGILKNIDFDLELIDLVADFAAKRKNNIYLVFDSVDPFGDKDVRGNFILIRAPRNEIMHSADEKIIDLVYQESNNKKNEICVVTSDNEIIKTLSEDKNLNQQKLKFLRSEEFINKISKNTIEEEEKEELDEKKKNVISQELLDIWKNQ